jgi:hypothetical protein
MTKGQLNFIIDAVMFLVLAAIVGLGLLMEYIMPPGRRLWEIYGSNPYITWLGWDRHDWGDIHFYLALAFLALLVLHIILHWSQILGLFHNLIPDEASRFKVFIVFVIVSVLLISFPFWITPERQPRGGGRGRHRSQVGVSGPQVPVRFDQPAILPSETERAGEFLQYAHEKGIPCKFTCDDQEISRR